MAMEIPTLKEYFDAIEEPEVEEEPEEEEEAPVREVHSHHEEKKASPKPVAKIKRFFRGSPKKLVS